MVSRQQEPLLIAYSGRAVFDSGRRCPGQKGLHKRSGRAGGHCCGLATLTAAGSGSRFAHAAHGGTRQPWRYSSGEGHIDFLCAGAPTAVCYSSGQGHKDASITRKGAANLPGCLSRIPPLKQHFWYLFLVQRAGATRAQYRPTVSCGCAASSALRLG